MSKHIKSLQFCNKIKIGNLDKGFFFIIIKDKGCIICHVGDSFLFGGQMLKKILMSLAVLGAASFAQDPNLHIYLAYGQSNMSGQATITDTDRQTNPRFLVLRAGNHSNQKVGEFYPAAPPMGHSGSKVGIVDFFGRKMIKELPDSITVAVANVAIGGQSIDLFDKDRNAAYVQNAKNKG